MHEHRIVVSRTARYFTVGELAPQTREVWIVLHGYGQSAEHFLRSFRPLDDGSRLVVAPEALSRFYRTGTSGHVGSSWMTKVDRESEIDDYIAYLDALADAVLPPGDEPVRRLVVLGFSQGAATAARWACRGRRRVDRLVLWGSHLPPDIDLVADGDRLTGLVSVLGTLDEYRSDEAVAHEHSRLREAGIPFEWIEFEGSHRIEAEPLLRLAAGIRQSVQEDRGRMNVSGV